MVSLVGVPARLKSAPVPLSDTVCGLFCAPSLIVSAPERIPDAVGVNVTLMVQLEPGARVAGQLLVCANPPVTWMLFRFSAALPLLVTAMVCAALDVPTA